MPPVRSRERGEEYQFSFFLFLFIKHWRIKREKERKRLIGFLVSLVVDKRERKCVLYGIDATPPLISSTMIKKACNFSKKNCLTKGILYKKVYFPGKSCTFSLIDVGANRKREEESAVRVCALTREKEIRGKESPSPRDPNNERGKK